MAYNDGLFRPTDQTSREAVKGTTSPHTSQDWHDKAYKSHLQDAQKKNPILKNKPSVKTDVGIAQGMLKNGADFHKTKDAVAKHSPALKAIHKNNPAGAKKDASLIVGKADRLNRNNQPRDQRQNVKPGHETQRGQISQSQASQKAAKPSTSAQMAAYKQYHSQKMSR